MSRLQTPPDDGPFRGHGSGVKPKKGSGMRRPKRLGEFRKKIVVWIKTLPRNEMHFLGESI